MRQDELRRAQEEAKADRKSIWRADPENRAHENFLSAQRMRKKRGPGLKSKERAAWEASQRTPEEQAAYKSRQLEKRAEERAHKEMNHRALLPPDYSSCTVGVTSNCCECRQPTEKDTFEITGPGGHPVYASASVEDSTIMECPLREMPNQMCYCERDEEHNELLFKLTLKNDRCHPESKKTWVAGNLQISDVVSSDIEIRINDIKVSSLRDCTHARAVINNSGFLFVTHYFHPMHGETPWGWEENFSLQIKCGKLPKGLIQITEKMFPKDEPIAASAKLDWQRLYLLLQEWGLFRIHCGDVVFQQFAWEKPVWRFSTRRRIWKAAHKRYSVQKKQCGLCWDCWEALQKSVPGPEGWQWGRGYPRITNPYCVKRPCRYKYRNPNIELRDVDSRAKRRTIEDCQGWAKCRVLKFWKEAAIGIATVDERMMLNATACDSFEVVAQGEQSSAGLLMDGSRDEDEIGIGLTAEI